MGGLPVQHRRGPALLSDPGSGLPKTRQHAEHEAGHEPKNERRPGPNGCRRYVRRRFAKALPEIATALIEQAKQGKLPELKVLVELSDLDGKRRSAEAARPRGKTIEDRLMEDWRKEPLD